MSSHKDDSNNLKKQIEMLEAELEQSRKTCTELRNSEEQYRLIAENATDLVSLHDPYGVYQYVSPSCYKLLGYTQEEMIGLNPYDLFHPDDTARVAQHHKQTQGMDQQPPISFRLRKKDGSYVWLETVSTMVSSKKESSSHIIAVTRNIEDKVAAQNALVQSEERYRLLFDNMNDGFALHEIITDENDQPIDYRFLDMNNVFEKRTGLSMDQLAGKTALELFPNTEKQWIEKFGKVALEGTPLHFTNYSGELDKYYETTVYCPKHRLFAGVFADVTERKKNENERERLLREIKKINEELEAIIYVASHDLRSPLVNLQGYSQELKLSCDHLKENLKSLDMPEKRRLEIDDIVDRDILESLGFISSSAGKMSMLIDGLLRLSRIGKNAISIQELDMNSMFKNITQNMEFVIREKKIEIVLEKLPSCNGDNAQINQIFTNLLDNAIKYMDPGKRCRIKVSGVVDGPKSIYCVEDNGIGIDAAHQGKIFETFHRLEPNGLIDGEGLGLTIVRRILARHGGSIRVESEAGVGSSFFVTLPREES